MCQTQLAKMTLGSRDREKDKVALLLSCFLQLPIPKAHAGPMEREKTSEGKRKALLESTCGDKLKKQESPPETSIPEEISSTAELCHFATTAHML